MPQTKRGRVLPDPEGEPELLVPITQMDQEIQDQFTRGQRLLDEVSGLVGQLQPYAQARYEALRDHFYSWDEFNQTLLRRRFSTGKVADEYRLVAFGFGASRPEYDALIDLLGDDISGQMRKLYSIRNQLRLYKSTEIPVGDGKLSPRFGDKIFIVHGHDGNIKLQVAEFVERITGDRPIILQEQVNSGRTVIEKFEAHAGEVGFAIILLTGDDEGRKKGAASLNPRARQNVVFEFGYFMAKLGRGRVVALHEPDVELPSDVAGILYESLSGNWKFELAREIQAADIEIELVKALR